MPNFLDGFRGGFRVLKQAWDDGNVCLLECKDSRTGELVAVLAVQGFEKDKDEVNLVLFGRLHGLASLNTLQCPDENGGFKPLREWRTWKTVDKVHSHPPHCEIQWIDCEGCPTPDKREAVAIVESEGKCYYICSDHLATMGVRSHHDKNCKHCSYTHWTGWKLVRMLP